MAAGNDELRSLDDAGFVLLRAVFSAGETAALADEATAALHADDDGGALRVMDGNVFAARNVAQLWPRAAELWRRPRLTGLLGAVLGPGFGLVRILFFDKPPEQTWALPWHRDRVIAVRDNRQPSERFSKPTCKAGVPHVKAPREVLLTMLTLRLHLDEVTEENGPLLVLPGSHRTDDETAGDAAPVPILAAAGDVLAMRPLLLHCSHRSHAATRRHRRILHLEFAASPALPDGYAWHAFVPGAGCSGINSPPTLP